MKRHEQLISLDAHPSLAALFASCPRPEWLPLLVDDRTHVASICFPHEDDNNGDSGDSDHDDGQLDSATKQSQSQSQPLPFAAFYSGDTTITIPNCLRCNVLRLHSLLRPIAATTTTSTQEQLPEDLFGKLDDNAVNPYLLARLTCSDQRVASAARRSFVRQHFVFLMNELMPIFSDSHLTACDAAAMFDRPELLDRILFSYSILLPALCGFRLHSFQDGTVDRCADEWKERYAELEGSRACQVVVTALTGMIRSLIDLRMRRIAVKLVQFIREELCAKRLLMLRPVWEHVWVPMVLVRRYDAESAKWIFDEEQRELWLRRIDDDDSSSSGDDE